MSDAPPSAEPPTETDAEPHFDVPPESAEPNPLLRSRVARLIDATTWTPPQRRAMAAVLAVVLVILAWRAIRNPAHVADPQPPRPARYADLADQLDPNVAAWEELVAIPQLGETRAKAIVEHRQDWLKRHPGDPAYKSPTDLAAVRGIGASTIESLTPYLMFPNQQAATQPQPAPKR